MSITKAMVLAAGLGTRMRPITDTIPKPLVEVSKRCLLDRALDQLERYGIEKVVVNVSYLAELIESHLGGRTHPHVETIFEETPLETGGGIYNALSLLGDTPFISMNSDTICVDTGEMSALERMVAAWDPEKMDVLMLLHEREKAIGFPGRGDFVVEEEGLRRRGEDVTAPYVFTGIQIIHPRLFTDVPSEPFSMNLLYDRLADEHGYFKRVGYLIHEGDWLHVGDPQGLNQAESYFENLTN